MSLVAVKIHNLCFGEVFFEWKNGAEGVAVFWQLFGLPTRLVVFLTNAILKPSSMTTKKTRTACVLMMHLKLGRFKFEQQIFGTQNVGYQFWGENTQIWEARPFFSHVGHLLRLEKNAFILVICFFFKRLNGVNEPLEFVVVFGSVGFVHQTNKTHPGKMWVISYKFKPTEKTGQ